MSRHHRRNYTTGQFGWNRESHLIANLATAALICCVLAVMLMGVYWR